MRILILAFIFLLMVSAQATAENESKQNILEGKSREYLLKRSDLKHALYFSSSHHKDKTKNKYDDDTRSYIYLFFSNDYGYYPDDLVSKYCTEFFALPSAKPSEEKELYKRCQHWGWSPKAQSKPQD